jgi:hypothetical protein
MHHGIVTTPPLVFKGLSGNVPRCALLYYFTLDDYYFTPDDFTLQGDKYYVYVFITLMLTSYFTLVTSFSLVLSSPLM